MTDVIYGTHNVSKVKNNLVIDGNLISDDVRVKEEIAKLKKLIAPYNTPTIIIARHGKPALNRKVWIDSKEYIDWWAQYDAGGLVKGQKVPRNLLNVVSRSERIIASPLRRAVETAEAVIGERSFSTDSIFVEAPLPPPILPSFVKLTPRMWGFVARCCWYVGMSGNQESHEDAKIRAAEAVEKLDSICTEYGSVTLLAHGWFNRMMRPFLKTKGYKCVYDGGDFHWSYRIYQK